MAVELDLADIQGNILTAYAQEEEGGYPKGRFMLFHICSSNSGRKFVIELLPMITTALRVPGRAASPKWRLISHSHGTGCWRSTFQSEHCAACRTNSSTA